MSAAGRCRPHRAARDAGFTLVELVMAVVILGIIMAGVASALMVSMATTREATDRLDDAADLMLASAFLTPDVQGASSMLANDQPGFPAPAAAPGCGTAAPLVLELRGPDVPIAAPPATLVTIPTTQTVVSYVLAAGGAQLERRECVGSATPVSSAVVARGLSTTVTPTVSCRTAAGAAVACADPSAASATLGMTSARGNPLSLAAGRRTS